jgi:hypothetical protein
MPNRNIEGQENQHSTPTDGNTLRPQRASDNAQRAPRVALGERRSSSQFGGRNAGHGIGPRLRAEGGEAHTVNMLEGAPSPKSAQRPTNIPHALRKKQSESKGNRGHHDGGTGRRARRWPPTLWRKGLSAPRSPSPGERPSWAKSTRRSQKNATARQPQDVTSC